MHHLWSHRRLAGFVGAVVIAAGCSACSLNSYNIGHSAVVQYPFIESIEPAAPLVAGQPGQLVLHVSMDATPGALTRPGYSWGFGSELTASYSITHTPFLEQIDGAPVPGSDIIFDFTPPSAGEVHLQFGGAATRAQGGQSLKTMITSSFMLPLGQQLVTYHDYTFTVAAAP